MSARRSCWTSADTHSLIMRVEEWWEMVMSQQCLCGEVVMYRLHPESTDQVRQETRLEGCLEACLFDERGKVKNRDCLLGGEEEWKLSLFLVPDGGGLEKVSKQVVMGFLGRW